MRSSSSVIVKLRSAQTAANASFRTTLQSITGTALTSSHAFQQSVRQNIQSFGTHSLDRIYVIPLAGPRDAQLISSQLAQLAEIEYAQPNYIYTIDAAQPNDPDFSKQWYIRNVRADQAWEITTGDSTIAIGILDTGVDWLHPDLATQFRINKAEDRNGNGVLDAWSSAEQRTDIFGRQVNGDLDGVDQDRNGYVDDVIGYDFVDQPSLNFGDTRDRDPIPGDEHSHGTQVSGVVAAKQNNAQGVSGVAPGCRIVALRAFDATGNAEDDDIAAAIVYAADNGIRILNLSFGDVVPSMLQRDAIRYAVDQGVTVFASSGNEGGFDRHYPSDFSEVVSVGATANIPHEDVLATLTVTGEGMDLLAPGTDIYTTDLDKGYKSVNGTSFSSPIAAAVGALLLSKDKRYTPEQIKGILVSTARDLGIKGYDPDMANGRVDALNALNYKGSASVRIASPRTNEGVKAGQRITVTGAANATLFTKWVLSYATALDPKKVIPPDAQRGWVTIAESTSQQLSGTLGEWHTQELAPGLYTLRLALYSSDDRVTEERINVYVTGEPPKITRFAVDSIYVHEKRGLLVDATADQVSRMAVRFRPVGSVQWSYKSDDRQTHTHSIILTTNELQQGVEYEIVTVVTNTSGDSVTISRNAILPDEGVNQRGFVQKPYALPPGYAVDSVISQPSGDHVAMSIFPNGINFGPLKIFTFKGSRFVQSDSLAQTWIPRAYGSTQNAVATDLLIQADRFSEMYRVGTGSKFLEQKIWESDRNTEFWGSTLADFDGNGLDEIVGKSSRANNNRLEDVYEVLAFRNNTFQSIATLTNPTAPEPGRSSNRFTEPNAARADLDGDGTEELLVIDNDADIIVYTFKNNAPSVLFTEENTGSGEGSTVAFGDVNGDGRKDIIYAFHSSFDQNAQREYDAFYWTVKVLLNVDGAQFRNVYQDLFYYARPLNPYRSSVSAIPNVTGRTSGENVVLSLFPNFYLLEWNSSINTLEPVWHYPATVSARGALAFDFDRNGIREFGFVAGDSIRFFERDGTFADRPLAPGGLTVTPVGEERVLLNWGRVEGAQKYFILKAAEGSPSFDLIDSVTTTEYTDIDIADGDAYFYTVIAIDDTKPLRESPLAFSIRAFIHPLPQVKRITPLRNQLKLVATVALNKHSLSGAEFVIDDSILLSTAVSGGDSVLVLTPSKALSAGAHSLRISSWELRDVFNSPFDTAARFTFVQPALTDDTARFYATRWRFDDRRIHVEFNSMPNDEALDVQFYSLTPYGKLLRVYRDTADANALYIDLDEKTKIVALGKPFVLCIRDIADVNDIEIDPLSGSCLGVTLTEPDLTNIMVYPNPVKRSDRELMFARLTAEAEIHIYTMDMRFLKRLNTTERNGGVRWDLRDENGEQLPSGIYLYSVTGKDDTGNEVESNTQKFVIITDQ